MSGYGRVNVVAGYVIMLDPSITNTAVAIYILEESLNSRKNRIPGKNKLESKVQYGVFRQFPVIHGRVIDDEQNVSRNRFMESLKLKGIVPKKGEKMDDFLVRADAEMVTKEANLHRETQSPDSGVGIHKVPSKYAPPTEEEKEEITRVLLEEIKVHGIILKDGEDLKEHMCTADGPTWNKFTAAQRTTRQRIDAAKGITPPNKVEEFPARTEDQYPMNGDALVERLTESGTKCLYASVKSHIVGECSGSVKDGLCDNHTGK
jgi:hypothetical protein